MKGIEKITEKIISEARAEAASITDAAREKALAISRSYAEKAADVRSSLDEAAATEAKAIATRTKASLETVQRTALLAEQAAIIDEVFADAYKSIRELDDEKYVAFLTTLAASALAEMTDTAEKNLELYGPDEDAEEIEKYELLLCKADRDKYAESILESIRRSVIGRVPSEIIEKLTVSKEVANIDGGLILRYGSIESNCSLSLLFERTRARLEGQVSKLLFTMSE